VPTLDWRESFNVLHTPHPKMIENHLRRLGEDALSVHTYPETLEEWELQREEVRARLLASMGEMPAEPCDLEPQVTGVLERDGYVIEKIRLQTRLGWFVGANLYRPPEQDTSLPGILCPHGHWQPGKVSKHVQARCATFARRGYVALALDMPGFGEREFTGHQNQFPLLTVGMTLGGIQLYDNMRCIDYLCSREEVDANRIGCTGASGGGNQTTYVSALDERIKASAPVCSVELYQEYFRKFFCICETIPGIVQVGDQPHVLGLVAPRALLLVSATLDGGFHILRANQALDRLKQIYQLYGKEEAVSLHEIYGDHSYEENARLGVYRWFDRWLKGVEADQYCEEQVWGEPEDSNTLFVGGLDEGMTIPHLTYLRVKEKLEAGGQPEEADQACRNLAEHCLGGLPQTDESLRVKEIETLYRGDHSVEKIALHTERDIIATGLLIKPEPAPAKLLACIYLLPAGKEAATRNRDVKGMLDAGCAVFALEPRGVGETSNGPNWEYHTRQTMTLGRLAAGTQAFDVMRAADYLQGRADIDAERLALWGEGTMAFIALLAAALDERFTKTCCYRLLASYCHDAHIQQESSHFLFDVIEQVGDICDIAKLVAPRELMIASPLDGSLHPASPEEHFQRTKEAYAAAGAADKLQLVDGGYEGMVAAWVDMLNR